MKKEKTGNNKRSQYIHTEPQNPQPPTPHRHPDHHHHQENGRKPIHAQQYNLMKIPTRQSSPQTLDPTPLQHEKILQRPPPHNDEHELASQQATMRRLQRELEIRSLALWQDSIVEGGSEEVACSGWERPAAAVREGGRKMGV